MSKDHVSIDISVSIDLSPKIRLGGSISKIEISPDGNYLVAAICGNQDHIIQKIVGWNVKYIKDIIGDEYEYKYEENNPIYVELHDKSHICVSNDRILACIDYDDNEFSKYNYFVKI